MTRMWRILLAAALTACGSPTAAGAASASAGATQGAPSARAPAPSAPPPAPARAGVYLPAARTGERLPLVLWLHGYGASGGLFTGQLGVSQLADELGFAFVAPDGTPDQSGRRFWNAGKACCDFDHQRPDHVGALRGVLDAALGEAAIDPARVYVIGYSNGAFMAHRLACEDERVRAIAAIAGAGLRADEPCPRKAPLALVAVHGDEDEVVAYEGGRVLGRDDVAEHPSVAVTLASWVQRNGCSGDLVKSGERDLQPKIPGDETLMMRHPSCAPPIELWLVRGGGHLVATRKAALALLFTALDRAARRPPP
jgi:polyhydroxybutyrate depolymerase